MRFATIPSWALALGALAAVGLAGPATAQEKKVVIGVQCDRTGPTQIVGTVLCPAMQDYYNYINSKGGIDGYKIDAPEIDNSYKVPPAVEAYERQKQQGAVIMSLYGTPQTHALNERLENDHMPTTSPGFGIAASADGTRYPYLFPIAATYFSQGAAAIDFAKRQLGGNLKGKKIAYVFYDNPAGKEPMPVLEDLQKQEGFELRTFAVPPPGVEMGAQVLDITQRYRPDFVIMHLFGRSPSVAIKELKRSGYPLSKVLGSRLGLGRGRHQGGRRLGRCRGVSHDAIRGRRRRLSDPAGNQGDVQERRQGTAEGDG